MGRGRLILLLLTTIFLSTEVCFNYIVLTTGDEDIVGATIKTLIFLLFIFLFSKKLTWAKWILSIGLVFYGIVCLIAGFELKAIFYIIGMYNIFFGIYIHKSKALEEFRNRNDESAGYVLSPGASNRKKALVMNKQYEYPTLVRRYQALLIDGLLILFTLMGVMLAVHGTEMRTPIMVSTVLLITSTYEPFLTSFSRTVGQRIMRIRVVRRNDPEERITLLNAYIRWFIKGLLGWISFVTIHFNADRRAIHDLASDSVIINERQ